ncbi:MAG TPA: bifunctional metallophosphatase/5'-nucleotidase [candidate division Zixibacteria bacterium]|nr:bifunctional metallophosphatase/5'-nucleotidase [candidate division Zixibacteria bacterium]
MHEFEANPVEAAKLTASLIAHRVDIVVLLSQLDIEENLAIAKEVCEIDIIISSDWKHFESEPMIIEDGEDCRTIIGCALGRGMQLGVLNTKWSTNGKLVNFEWNPRTLDEKFPPDQKAFDIVSAIAESLETVQKFVITKSLDARDAILAGGESNAGNLLCEALLAKFPRADIAFVPAGSFFGDRILPEGIITANDIRELLPYEDKAALISIDGATLLGLVERSASMLGRHRGGFMQIAGAEVFINTSRSEAQISVAGSPIDANARYTIITTDFVAEGGFGYSELAGLPFERGGLITDILLEHLANNGTSPDWDDRIRILP